MLKKRDILIYCIIAFFLIIFNGDLSYAVTGTPGSTVKVTYNINSPDGGNLSTVTGKIDYDEKVLELVSISSSAGVAGNGRVSATESQINGTSMSVTATYNIKSSAEDTTVATKLNVSELYTKNSENNHSTTVTGNVTVKKASNSSNSTTTNTSNEVTQNTSATTGTSNSSSNSTSSVNTSTNSNANSNTNTNNSSNTSKEVTFKSTNETMYTANRVNLRTQYGTSGNIVKTLAEGEELTRTGYSTTNVDGYSWSRVTYNGGTYYCITKSLTATKPEKNEQDDKNATVNQIANNTNELTENTTNEIANETTETNEIVNTQTTNADITKLEIVGYTLAPSFDSNIYEYSLTVGKDVSNLDVKAEAASDNVKIEIAGNTELKDEENVITVICYNQETKNNTTYQIIVKKENDENPHAEAILEAKQKRSLIIKIGIVIIIVLIILCIIVFRKGKEEEEQEAEEEKKKVKEEKSMDITDERKQRRERAVANQEQKRERKTRNLDEKNSETRKERKNINNDEIRESKSKERKLSEQSVTRGLKGQNNRDEEFDEKLERIKRKQKRQEKSGKHF